MNLFHTLAKNYSPLTKKKSSSSRFLRVGHQQVQLWMAVSPVWDLAAKWWVTHLPLVPCFLHGRSASGINETLHLESVSQAFLRMLLEFCFEGGNWRSPTHVPPGLSVIALKLSSTTMELQMRHPLAQQPGTPRRLGAPDCCFVNKCKQQSGLVTKSKEATLSFTKKNVNILAANQGDSRRPTPASSHRGQLQLFPGHCFRARAVCWGKSEYIYLVSVNVPVWAASLPERWNFTYQ